MNPLFLALIELSCLLLLIFSLVGLFARLNWLIDLTNHTRPYLLFMGVFALFPALFFNLQIGLYAAFATCMINGYIVVPYFVPRFKRVSASQTTQTLMTANVYYSNRSPKLLLAAISKVDPDILILQEMSARIQRSGAILWEKYPYVSNRPNGGSQEVLIFSKLPLDSVKHIVGDKPWRSEVEVQLTINKTVVTVLGIHPKAPMSADRFLRRNAELHNIAERVSDLNTPIIVAGDMNITPWTPVFRHFLRQAKLNDGRKRQGFNFTWSPGRLPKMIPIDHVLYRGIDLHSFKSGPDSGSDHLPVIIEFSVPQTNQPVS